MTGDNRGEAQSRQGKGEKLRRIADAGGPENSGQRSEEYYRTLFEHADAAMFLVDDDGKILEANQQACLLLGYERDALLRLHIDDLKSGKRFPSASRGIKSGFSVVDELLLHRDGTQIPVGISSVSITVDGESLFLCCLKEIAKQKSVEVALLGSEQTYRLITENTSDYIALLTLDGICIYASPSHRHLGYKPRDLLGRSGFSMLHREDRRRLLSLIKKYARLDEEALLELKQKGQSERFDFRIRDKSGEWRCMEATANLVRNPETNAHNVLIIYRDVTEQRRMEEDLRQTLRMKSEFYSHVSHELRNPLNFILGYAQLLALEQGLSDAQKRYVRNILAGGERLVPLIEEFFELSKLDSGHETLNRDMHRLREILAMVCEDHRLSAQKKGIGLILLEGKVLDDAVSVDLVKFRQALDNLVGNAIKYTPAGGKISIELAKRDSYFHIQIKDNGVGISSKDHDRIFQEFVRVEHQVGKDQETVPGTGLGLPIAKRIVHLHGGRIELNSEPGKGSVFTVIIPTRTTGGEAPHRHG